MEYLNTTHIISFLIGVSLAACAGFRIFVPLLISSIAFKMGWISPIESLKWLGSTSALIIFLVAAIFESLAFLIPWLDHAFDVIAAPLATAAGMLLASAVLKDMPTSMQVGLGIVAGGGAAGMVHATSSLLRLGSTKFTGGLGNPFFAKIETLISGIGSIIAIFLPVVMILGLFLFFGAAYWILKKTILKSKPSSPPNIKN